MGDSSHGDDLRPGLWGEGLFVGGHGGPDGAGVDGVDADVVAGEFYCGGLGEDADGAFGGVVGGVALGDHAGDGGDVDDGAAAGSAHVGDDGFGAEEDAFGVDGHDSIPGFFGGFFEVVALDDAGVVDEDVDFAEVGEGGLDGAVPVGLDADVHFYEDGLAADVGDFFGDAEAVFDLDVGEDDFGAFVGEDAGFGGAHAAGGACDDGYFVLESHFSPFGVGVGGSP